MPALDIVIVNWNSGEQLRECLESIAAAATAREIVNRVVVIDNASTDGSAERVICRELPLQVVRNDRNRGFAAACNQGAAAAGADYLLLLNPDARLYRDSLAGPLAFMSAPANHDVAICGVQMNDESGSIWRSCSRFPTSRLVIGQALGLDKVLPRWFPSQAMLEWDHTTTRAVDEVSGAFFWVRRSAWDRLGGLDETFFMYYEEVDFCLRAAHLGYRTVFLADTRAFHRGAGTSQSIKARRLFYSRRSRVTYAAKHFSRLEAAGVLGATLLAEPWPRLVRAALRQSVRDATETVHGFAMLWGALPQLVGAVRAGPACGSGR